MRKPVYVIGGGRMGRGIAQTIAAAGFKTVICELNQQLADTAMAGICESLQTAVDREKISIGQMNKTLENLSAVSDLKKASNASLVIEAVVEKLDVKKNLFFELDSICDSSTILATNTSALSISDIASVCGDPGRVVGMHFFNPVPSMKLVEIVCGAETRDDTAGDVISFTEAIGKTPVLVKESPGFVVNRLVIPLINEAAIVASENIANVKDIDTAMMLGANHPMGPLALADLIGIDIVVEILETLAAELGEGKYKPCKLLYEMISDGKLGKKTGSGFYEYSPK